MASPRAVRKVLLNRLNTGQWDNAARQPAAPAFQAFAPGPYQRPFDLLPFQF